MAERSTTPQPWRSDAGVMGPRMPFRPVPAMLSRNPPHRHAMAAMTSAERMRLLRQRRAKGETGSSSCRACGAKWQPRLATFARLQAGLCARCWQATPEGAQERRAADQRRYAANIERRRQGVERVRRLRARRRAGQQPS